MKPKDIYLVLHNIRSAYNVGAIFRTADAAGVKKIFLCGYTPCPTMDNRLSPVEKIKKTALGAEKTVAWEYYAQTWRLLEKLNKDNIKIVALEQSPKSQNIFSAQGGSASGGKFNPKFPMALILGNEVKGLSQSILKHCDDIIEIPVHGAMVRQAHHPRHTRRGKESLNVSVAAGIAIYQLLFNSRYKSANNANQRIIK